MQPSRRAVRLVLVLCVVVGSVAGILASRVFELEVEGKALLETGTDAPPPVPGREAAPAPPPGGTPASFASERSAEPSGRFEPGEGTSTPAWLRPLELRLVDAGAVGIPADTASWGTTYSHATHAFDELLLPAPPWVDGAAYADVRRDWERYVGRMARYGNNGVVVDAFLELVNFDLVGDGAAVYAADSPMRARHEAVRGHFRELFETAAEAGMGTYLKTDMLALTPELERHLRAATGGLDASDPEVWDVYARGFEELFRQLPSVAGVVIRIGEAGPLFNVVGVEYRSEMAFQRPEEVRLMLRSLLPVFERHGRTLIFRSWSVGVGGLGDLHNDPDAYMASLGGIDSPSLVVSTKFGQGDYFGFLPLNPTLAVGSQRRLVEFQARREFEGFGAFPNFMGALHGDALLALRARNPRIVGMSLWTQEGGPLKAGPISLYPLSGFWRWIDANVYATSRLAREPGAAPSALARDWVRATISEDPAVVEGLAEVLLLSREATEKALYIRPYADLRVEIADFEVPPLLWIQEWDQVGGWTAVSSALHHLVGEARARAVAEGFQAVELTREMQATLTGLEPRLGDHPDFPGMTRSLEYQRSLFETLAWYRAAFLDYYRWLETGRGEWRPAARRFESLAREHEAAFAEDLDFPAFEMGPALRGFERAERGPLAAGAARAVLALLGLLLVAGAPPVRRRTPDHPGKGLARAMWAGVTRPWAVEEELAGRAGVGWALVAVGAVVAALLPTLLVAFGAAGPGLGLVAVLAVFGGVLAWSRGGGGLRLDPWAPSALAPLLLPASLVLAIVAIRGPDLFWALAWTDDVARAGLFAVAGSAGLWTAAGLILAAGPRRDAGAASSASSGSAAPRPGSPRIGASESVIASTAGLLLATGAALLALAVALPGLDEALVALDDPMGVLPMTRAIVNGITVYTGLPGFVEHAPLVVGAALLAAGTAARVGAERRAGAA